MIYVVILMTVGLIVALVVLVLGRYAVWPSTVAVYAAALSHSIGGVWLVVTMLFFVPQSARLFEEFDWQLPALSRLVLQVSDLCVHFFYLLVPLVLGTLCASAWLCVSLHKQPATRVWARRWSATMTAAIVTCILLSILAVVVPAWGLWRAIEMPAPILG